MVNIGIIAGKLQTKPQVEVNPNSKGSDRASFNFIDSDGNMYQNVLTYLDTAKILLRDGQAGMDVSLHASLTPMGYKKGPNGETLFSLFVRDVAYRGSNTAHYQATSNRINLRGVLEENPVINTENGQQVLDIKLKVDSDRRKNTDGFDIISMRIRNTEDITILSQCGKGTELNACVKLKPEQGSFIVHIETDYIEVFKREPLSVQMPSITGINNTATFNSGVLKVTTAGIIDNSGKQYDFSSIPNAAGQNNNGFIINSSHRLINSNGELINEQGQRVDEVGNVIQVVPQAITQTIPDLTQSATNNTATFNSGVLKVTTAGIVDNSGKQYDFSSIPNAAGQNNNGFIINSSHRLINSNGELINEQGQRVDEAGNVIQVVPQTMPGVVPQTITQTIPGAVPQTATTGTPSFNTGVAPGVPTFDAGATTGTPSFNTGVAPGAPTFDAGATAGTPSFNTGVAPGAPTFDAGATAGTPSFNTGVAPGVPSFNTGAVTPNLTGTTNIFGNQS